MNTQVKKAILIFGGGIVLFWAFKTIFPIGGKSKSKKSSKTSSKTDEKTRNALVVLKAYREAQKAGENKAFLDEMNVEFAKEFQLRVMTDKGSGKLFVSDLEGNKVI
jgi:hypothetical protein